MKRRKGFGSLKTNSMASTTYTNASDGRLQHTFQKHPYHPAENRSEPIAPFGCDEELLMRFVGDVLASSASDYRLAGIGIKKAERKYLLGQIGPKQLITTVQNCGSVMNRERTFMLSDRFHILLGESEMSGQEYLRLLDAEIERYDPETDVPENNPKTGKPYNIKEWRRILERRGK